MTGETLFWDLETDHIADFRGATIQKSLITAFCGIFSPGGEEVRLVLRKGHTVEDAKQFRDGIAQALERADRTVVFNGFAFDFIALSGIFPKDVVKRWAAKTTDPMVAIMRQNDGYPKSLNDLARANGLQQKTMRGVEAPQAWHNGENDRLLDYCMHDVRILKALFEKRTVLLPAKLEKYEKTVDFATEEVGGVIGRRGVSR
jgi:hypothetical protein